MKLYQTIKTVLSDFQTPLKLVAPCVFNILLQNSIKLYLVKVSRAVVMQIYELGYHIT